MKNASTAEIAIAIKHDADLSERATTRSREKFPTPGCSSDSLNAIDDAEIVDFDDNDPEDPQNWPLWRKWSTVSLVALMFMLANFGTITIVPAVPLVLQEFRIPDSLYSTLLVSIWELGEGVGPFFVGPLSERYGRMPIYHTGNILFIVFSVAAALSTNISMLVAFRFLNGLAVTSLTLGPSIVGDVFRKEERGAAMSIAIAVPLLGPFVVPVVGGYVADALGWRWTIWIVVIAVGVVTILSLVVCRSETYKVKILERKAARLRKQTGNPRLRPRGQQDEKMTRPKYVVDMMIRPMRMLFSSPIVLVISLYTALTYGLSYLILTTLAEIMQHTYHLSQGPLGITFLGRAIGNIIGMLLYGLVSDRYMKYKKAKEGTADAKPEHRLMLMVVGAIVLPLGLFLYGWTAAHHVAWIAPLIGTALVGFSMLLTILPTENYLVDVFDDAGTSASAVGAGVILRALFGALFPLIGPPLYASPLGLGWGNSLLAFIALAFIPPLVFLWQYGDRIRQRERPWSGGNQPR